MRLLFAIVATLFVATATAVAQVQSAAGRVAGRVVTGYGELVTDATVTLSGRTSDDRALWQTSISDSSGSFSFERVPEGRYRVIVAKDGFTDRQPFDPDAPQARGDAAFRAEPEIELGDGAQITTLQLVLHRAASIVGRVVRSDGSPAANVQVFVASQSANGPRPLLDTRSATQSDGTYEIRGLPSGDYLVGALSQQPPRDLTWTWHPGGANAEPGTVVSVLEGIDLEGIDIWLAPPQRFTVSGRVSWPVGVSAEDVMIHYGDPAGTRSGVWTVSDPAGVFTLLGVSPGPLTLLARAESDQGGLIGIARTEVTSDSVDGVNIVVDRPGTIGGRVVYEKDVPPSARAASISAMQQLVRLSSLFPVPESPVDDMGRFALRGAIGEYEFAIAGLGPGLAIKRVSRNGAPLPRNRITIAGGEIVDDIEIVVGHAAP